MKVTPTELPEVLLIKPEVFGDERGYFFESHSRVKYGAAGIHAEFVQDNISRSDHRILRGLHLQHPHDQGKLVSVLEGEVFDVAVDVRLGSPRFGQWTGRSLSVENKHQLYIPPGFAHGFCVTSKCALFHYKCTDNYDPASEIALAWNDPALAIAWPVRDPVVSARDGAAAVLADVDRNRLPVFDAQRWS